MVNSWLVTLFVVGPTTSKLSAVHSNPSLIMCRLGKKSGSNLWAIYAALSSAGHPIAHDPEDHAYLVKIASGVSDAIRPLLDIPSLDQGTHRACGSFDLRNTLLIHVADDTAYGSLAYRGETGLRILHVLLATYGLQPTPDMLIVAAAFTNKNDPWTTTLARDTAHALLQISLPTPDKRHSFIADTLLARFLRSRFSESRPVTVTATGRKAEYVDSSRYDGRNALDDEMAIRPWKYREQYAISVLEWAVVESDVI